MGWCAARHLQRSSRVLTRKLLSVLTARRREAGNGQAHYMPGAENVSPTRGRGGGTGWLRKRAKSMPIHLGRIYRPGHSRMLDDLRDDKNRAFPVFPSKGDQSLNHHHTRTFRRLDAISPSSPSFDVACFQHLAIGLASPTTSSFVRFDDARQ